MSYLKACKSPLPVTVIKTVDTELLGGGVKQCIRSP